MSMKKTIAVTITCSILALMILWQYQEARAVRLVHAENMALRSAIPRMALYNALTNRNLQAILSNYGMRLSKLETTAPAFPIMPGEG